MILGQKVNLWWINNIYIELIRDQNWVLTISTTCLLWSLKEKTLTHTFFSHQRLICFSKLGLYSTKPLFFFFIPTNHWRKGQLIRLMVHYFWIFRFLVQSLSFFELHLLTSWFRTLAIFLFSFLSQASKVHSTIIATDSLNGLATRKLELG